MIVDEGDNAPLPIASARLLVPNVALRYYDPGVPLTLRYGNPKAEPPRYDLALLATRVFAAPAHDVALSNDLKAAPDTTTNNERRFFWIAIVAVVAVLLVLLARLLRT